MPLLPRLLQQCIYIYSEGLRDGSCETNLKWKCSFSLFCVDNSVFVYIFYMGRYFSCTNIWLMFGTFFSSSSFQLFILLIKWSNCLFSLAQNPSRSQTNKQTDKWISFTKSKHFKRHAFFSVPCTHSSPFDFQITWNMWMVCAYGVDSTMPFIIRFNPEMYPFKFVCRRQDTHIISVGVRHHFGITVIRNNCNVCVFLLVFVCAQWVLLLSSFWCRHCLLWARARARSRMA